jgi:hypothetical protein
MPARSKAQQKAAGAALSAKRGETGKSQLKGASRGMYETMTERQLEEFAETKRKGLPNRTGPARAAAKGRPAASKTKARSVATRSKGKSRGGTRSRGRG